MHQPARFVLDDDIGYEPACPRSRVFDPGEACFEPADPKGKARFRFVKKRQPASLFLPFLFSVHFRSNRRPIAKVGREEFHHSRKSPESSRCASR
jgi:hypothetical protein